MNVSELLTLFKKKPYTVKYSVNRLSQRFKCTVEDALKAKKILLLNSSNSANEEHHITPKILIFDIETSPMKAYVWNRWHTNIYLEQTISEWFCIAWSAKWLYSNEVIGEVVTPIEALKEDDSRIMKKLYELISQADIIVAHNGDKFDIPKINSRFISLGLPPYKPVFSIDTLKVAKKQFGFSSNKLDALAEYFGIPHKLETSFDLWKRCLNGDVKSLQYMLEYNKMDVKILEEVYLRLRPWIKGHPNIANIYNEDELNCSACGSDKLELLPNQYYYTSVGQYQLYRCKECGALSRGRKALNKVKDIKVTSVGK